MILKSPNCTQQSTVNSQQSTVLIGKGLIIFGLVTYFRRAALVQETWNDVMLMLFDVVVAIGLWRGFPWSVWLVFSGILLLQFVPYTLLRSQFVLKPEDGQTLNSLLGTEASLLGIFALLLWLRK